MGKFNTKELKEYICDTLPKLKPEYWGLGDPEVAEYFSDIKHWKRFNKQKLTIRELWLKGKDEGLYDSFFQYDKCELVTCKANDDSGFFEICHVFDDSVFRDEQTVLVMREFYAPDTDLQVAIFTNVDDDTIVAIHHYRDN